MNNKQHSAEAGTFLSEIPLYAIILGSVLITVDTVKKYNNAIRDIQGTQPRTAESMLIERADS